MKRRDADEAMAANLAAGWTVKDTAEAAKISERTIYRRLEESTFRARVTQLRSEMVSRAAGRLADSMSAAADVLKALLSSDADGVRLRAADLLLSHSVKIVELEELQARVEALERSARGTP